MKCSKCEKENDSCCNFCVFCGTKLKSTCRCWVKKKDNYNCGESSCPGYGLFKIEKSKS